MEITEKQITVVIVLKKGLHMLYWIPWIKIYPFITVKMNPKNEQRYLLYLSPSLALDVISEQTTEFRL